MSDAFLVIDAAAIVTPEERFSPGRVLIRHHTVESVGIPADVKLPGDGITRVDASHLTLVPGFIDPHIHGCGGVDVMDATFESLNIISRTLARHGTTAFLPTTVSSPSTFLESTIDRLAPLMNHEFEGAQPLGIHLEGPFISVQKRGTHNAANIAAPDVKALAEWIKRSPAAVKLLTMAPELDGAESLTEYARKLGITVAMGHSDATYEQAMAAADGGTRYAVHTFNAMRAFTHRDPGIVGAVLADDRVFAEIIADGVHVNPEVVRIFARCKPRNRILLVTDAISATDMPDGHYLLGTDKVEVRGGICRNREGRLAGSTLTQEVALRNFVSWSGMKFEDALHAVTLNPAAALKLDSRGRIKAGAHADMTLLDNEFRVVKTFVGGKLAFERHS